MIAAKSSITSLRKCAENLVKKPEKDMFEVDYSFFSCGKGGIYESQN